MLETEPRFLFQAMEKGADKAVIKVTFTAEAAADRLNFSQDRNVEVHKQLLQGAALNDAIGTCISIWMPGMGPTDLAAAKFKAPALVGDTVTVTLERKGGRKTRPEISFSVFNDTGNCHMIESGYTLRSTDAMLRAELARREQEAEAEQIAA